MHRDPTFDAVYWLECKKIRKQAGCSSCGHRGEYLAWDEYQCKLNHQKNKHGYCRQWQSRG